MKKRPMFIIISIPAKVFDTPRMFHKWGVIKSCTAGRGRQNSWPDTDQRGIPCHTRHTHFKAGGSWGSFFLRPWPASEEDPARCPACDRDPDSDLWIPESSSHLLLSPVWDFLVSAVQPLAGCQRPWHPTPGNSLLVFYDLHYFSYY